LRQSSVSRFKKKNKNKNTAPSHPLSLIQTLLPHRITSPPRSNKAKQGHQTATSPPPSQGTEARPRASAVAPAAPVASSAAVPTNTTPPERPNRQKETASQPRPTKRQPCLPPRIQSTSCKTEHPRRVHSQAQVFKTSPMSISTSYSEPSLWLSKPRAHSAPEQHRVRRACQPRALA